MLLNRVIFPLNRKIRNTNIASFKIISLLIKTYRLAKKPYKVGQVK